MLPANLLFFFFLYFSFLNSCSLSFFTSFSIVAIFFLSICWIPSFFLFSVFFLLLFFYLVFLFVSLFCLMLSVVLISFVCNPRLCSLMVSTGIRSTSSSQKKRKVLKVADGPLESCGCEMKKNVWHCLTPFSGSSFRSTRRTSKAASRLPHTVVKMSCRWCLGPVSFQDVDCRSCRMPPSICRREQFCLIVTSHLTSQAARTWPLTLPCLAACRDRGWGWGSGRWRRQVLENKRSFCIL